MGEAALEYLIGVHPRARRRAGRGHRGSARARPRAPRRAARERAATSTRCSTRRRPRIAQTFEYAGPGYLAYIPGGGLYTAALGGLPRAGRQPVRRACGSRAPRWSQIEENVTRWLCDLFEYPAGSQGCSCHGRLDGEPVGHGHGAPREARRGLPRRHLLRQRAGARERHEGRDDRRASRSGTCASCPPTTSCGWTPTRSRAMIAEDRAAGLRPFLVAPRPAPRTRARSTRSTTIADVAEREGLWLHVDGAYGGFFQLTDRGRERFRGHRAQRLHHARPAQGPVPAVRDGRARRPRRRSAARRALRGRRVPPGPAAGGRAAELQRALARALARRARAARVVPAAAARGRRVPRGARREARPRPVPRRRLRATTRARARLAAPAHAWSPFRLAGGRRRDAEGVPRRINASKRVFLSSTLIDGRYVLRVVHRVATARTRTASTSASRSSAAAAAELLAWGDAVPELPEVQALAERLDEVAGRRATLEALDILQFSSLKTFAPRPDELLGPDDRRSSAAAGSTWSLEFDGGRRLLVHLSQGGRVDVEAPPKTTKPRGAVLRLRVADRPCVLVKEFGTQRKAGWWVLARGRRRAAREARPRGRSSPEADELLRDERGQPPRPHDPARPAHDRRASAAATATTSSTARSSRPTRRSPSSTPTSAERLVDVVHGDPRRRARGRAAAHRAVCRRSSATTSPCTTTPGSPARAAAPTSGGCRYESYEVTYCPDCQTGGKVLADRRHGPPPALSVARWP